MEGITIANSAYHSVSLSSSYQADSPDDIIRWVKIFTWRGNGDGVGSSGNQVVEDCFVRTQDDGSYAAGRGMKRVVFWQDSNGASFVLNHIGQNTDEDNRDERGNNLIPQVFFLFSSTLYPSLTP